MAKTTDDTLLPREPIHRLVEPVVRFMHVEAASGVLLLVCTAVALVLANSAAGGWYAAIWKTQVGFAIGDFSMMHSLKHWINDGLMAVFFFVVGLEVKRELVHGRAARPAPGRAAGGGGPGRHDRAGGRLPAAAGRRRRGPGLGHPHGHGHRLRRRLHGGAGTAGAEDPAGAAAVAGHRRRHRRHPGDRHRLHRVAGPADAGPGGRRAGAGLGPGPPGRAQLRGLCADRRGGLVRLPRVGGARHHRRRAAGAADARGHLPAHRHRQPTAAPGRRHPARRRLGRPEPPLGRGARLHRGRARGDLAPGVPRRHGCTPGPAS